MQRPFSKTTPLTALCSSALLGLCASASGAPLTLSESPLFVSGFVDPNILFLVDNSGSMSNIVPDAPYDEATTDIGCPLANIIGNGSPIEIRVTLSGNPYFNAGGTDYDWGTETAVGTTGLTGLSVRCFDPTLDYMARLYANGGAATDTKTSSGYLAGQYSGHYLNWYFGSDPAADCSSYTTQTQATNWGTNARKHPCNEQRIEIAKHATTSLISSLGNVRVGLATYNGSAGARIDVGLDSITTNRASLIAGVNALSPSGSTPLAESLHQIGRYFVGESGASNGGGPNGQYDGSLTLHPGESDETTMDDDTVFDASPSYSAGVSDESPIQAFCQQNFAVLLTDGRPQSDQGINSSTGLADYDGDCTSTDPSYNGTACGSHDTKSGQLYEGEGSDYLDDVALALRELDLRPDMDDFQNNEVVNNITTYTIGFADDQVINDPLMKDTAKNGGGKFLQAGNAAELTAAFSSATLDIFSQVGSAAAVGSTSGSVSSDTRLFQGRFNSGNWTGQLLSFVVQADGSVDTNSPEWDAAAKLTDSYLPQRDILTIDPTATPNPVGIAFRWNDLNAAQQAAMNTRPDGTADAAGSEEGQNRTDFIRGARSDEGVNGKGYRIRSSLLGDIMNSEPIYVGAPPFDYPDGLESGQTYTQFKRSSAKDRKPVVYVGANDGMLHGFDASLDPSTGGPTATSGQEVIAYIPNKLIPKLTQLTNPNYSHKMFVDGSPLAGDIYKSNNTWATILAGPLGLGGQGLYALDITDPTNFDESNANQVVLWEFADTNDADLGYVYGALNIVRMKPASNGPWAVVAGNGYNNTEADGNASASGNAALFIINAETGALIRKIDTGVGTAQDPLAANRPNGLAPSAPIDIDNDHIIDYIYAGDLFGNLWKFDVRSDNSLSWTASKIFTAVDAAGNSQPITSQVAVSRHLSEDGFMIYFGTGKYLEPADTNPAGAVTQTFYGIWDDLSGSSIDRNIGLHVQTILAEVDNPFNSNEELRITSDTTPDIDWTTDRGWRMDLINTEGGNINNFGERVITDPVYLPPSKKFPNGRILFTTLIPNSQMCGYGGSGWFMELDPNDGSRLSHPPFDITGEGHVDFSDVVVWNSSDTIVSGRRTKFGLGSGIPTEPKVLEGAQGEFKYGSDTTGAISVTKEPPPFTGRTSWRELLSD